MNTQPNALVGRASSLGLRMRRARITYFCTDRKPNQAAFQPASQPATCRSLVPFSLEFTQSLSNQLGSIARFRRYLNFFLIVLLLRIWLICFFAIVFPSLKLFIANIRYPCHVALRRMWIIVLFKFDCPVLFGHFIKNIQHKTHILCAIQHDLHLQWINFVFSS